MITVIASAGEIVAISGFHTGKQIRRKKKAAEQRITGLCENDRHGFENTASVSSRGAQCSQQQRDLQQRPRFTASGTVRRCTGEWTVADILLLCAASSS